MFSFRKWIDVHLMWWPYLVLLSESHFVQHYVHVSDVFYNSCRVFTLCRAAASWHLSCVHRHCASCSVPRRTSAFGALFWQSAAFYQWEVKTKLLEVWKRLLWLNSCWKLQIGWDLLSLQLCHPIGKKEAWSSVRNFPGSDLELIFDLKVLSWWWENGGNESEGQKVFNMTTAFSFRLLSFNKFNHR